MGARINEGGWDDIDWANLLLAIETKECTPFIGAGACHGVLKTGKAIAGELVKDGAKTFGVFPYLESENLSKVTQWLRVRSHSSSTARNLFLKKLTNGLPDFTDPLEPHRFLADLQLPVYITTNYDSFMMKALKAAPGLPNPSQAVCKWNQIYGKNPPDLALGMEPDAKSPVVFHMHGVIEDKDSMVLTEDDYVDFLIAISERPDLIPPRIQDAFATTAVLFMGYSLEDMDFKVVFRKLTSFMKRNKGARHVSVQLAPRATETREEHQARVLAQEAYLGDLLEESNVKIYWGTCREFVQAMRAKLAEHAAATPA